MLPINKKHLFDKFYYSDILPEEVLYSIMDFDNISKLTSIKVYDSSIQKRCITEYKITVNYAGESNYLINTIDVIDHTSTMHNNKYEFIWSDGSPKINQINLNGEKYSSFKYINDGVTRIIVKTLFDADDTVLYTNDNVKYILTSGTSKDVYKFDTHGDLITYKDKQKPCKLIAVDTETDCIMQIAANNQNKVMLLSNYVYGKKHGRNIHGKPDYNIVGNYRQYYMPTYNKSDNTINKYIYARKTCDTFDIGSDDFLNTKLVDFINGEISNITKSYYFGDMLVYIEKGTKIYNLLYSQYIDARLVEDAEAFFNDDEGTLDDDFEEDIIEIDDDDDEDDDIEDYDDEEDIDIDEFEDEEKDKTIDNDKSSKPSKDKLPVFDIKYFLNNISLCTNTNSVYLKNIELFRNIVRYVNANFSNYKICSQLDKDRIAAICEKTRREFERKADNDKLKHDKKSKSKRPSKKKIKVD